MKNTNPLLVPELRELLATKDGKTIRDLCETGHPANVADLISPLEPKEVWAILEYLNSELRAEIFRHLDEDVQIEIMEDLPRKEVAHILAEMHPDDRADLFKQLPESLQESVLPAMAQAEREDIRRLISFREGTAGAVMTSDYAALPPQLTAAQAIDRLREVAPDKETIYYAYVVDDERKLLGYVSLKDLIIARRDARVEAIMQTEAVYCRVDDDQEDAARKIQKYDLLALPVLNGGDALVGIITHDDALDIITQEHTEDMEKFMAIAGSHEDSVYIKTSAWRHFKNRAPWVVLLAILGLLSGFIVQSFEGLLFQFAILLTFMPMLAATGGNTGSQAASLVVRALALREIHPRDILGILTKEFQVSLMLAILLGVIAFARVMIFEGNANTPGNSLLTVGLAISIALGLQVITSTLIGALLPLGAAKLKLDPAVVASPALTTIVDITGLLIFFLTAKTMLSI